MAHRVSERTDLSRPVTAAFEVLREEGHWRRRIALQPQLRTELVTFEASPSRVLVVTRSAIPADWLPERVRHRMHGLGGGDIADAPAVDREEDWALSGEDGATGRLRFTFHGVPASAEGTGRLQPRPGGSAASIDIVVRVPIPFVGGLIERAVTPQIARSVRLELAAWA